MAIFFAAVLKSQKHLLNTFEARLWCKFFLLSVFVTMYLNDLQRGDFYSTIGLDAKQFDIHVIRKTNQSAGTLFPIILDLDNPKLLVYLENCAEANQGLIDIEKSDNLEFIKTLNKIPQYFKMVTNLINLYLVPAIETKYIWTEQ
jgi:magnesium-protoporphyrin IX monomethyl ester (oxidative) cyclase